MPRSSEPLPLPDQGQPDKRRLISISAKGCWWLAAWGGVILIFLVTNPACLRFALWFPAGLFAICQPEEKALETSLTAFGTGAFFLGWGIYFVLSVFMLLAKKRTLFVILYLIFCLVLLLNVGGCQRLWDAVAQI
jgi:hypothetical protein